MCCSSGRGRERAMAAMTASFSSSESMGPVVSKSSGRGALAEMAASVFDVRRSLKLGPMEPG